MRPIDLAASSSSPLSFATLALLGLSAVAALACSTGSSTAQQGGMGMSGVTSTVHDTFGTKAERVARRCDAERAREHGLRDGADGDPLDALTYERCPPELRAAAVAGYKDGHAAGLSSYNASLCTLEQARKKGLRHGRWLAAENKEMFASCPPEVQAAYSEHFRGGREEYLAARAYYAEQERVCSEAFGYELGYEHGMENEPPNSASLTRCEDALRREQGVAQYALGYEEGQQAFKAIAARAQRDRQQVVCDPQLAFEAGVREGEQHRMMDSSWLLQCEDAEQRSEAQSRYEFGYIQGFGMMLAEEALQREQALQRRYRALSPEQQVACSPNGALSAGYDDGYFDQTTQRATFEGCQDAELRELALERYAYGRVEGEQAYTEENGYTQEQYAQMQACDKDIAYEAGRQDGRAYRAMDSDWLSRCRDLEAQRLARRAYRRGYDDGLYD